MDQVPRVFREQVAALWKCCERFHCRHRNKSDHQTPDCPWTVKKRWIYFNVTSESNKWLYGFRDSDNNEYVTMDVVKKWPDFLLVVIRGIIVLDPPSIPNAKHQVVDMAALMRFVTYLSNEPTLEILSPITKQSFSSPDGRTFFTRLQEMHFTDIRINYYEANFNRLLEAQFSRRKVTRYTSNNQQRSTFFVTGIGCSPHKSYQSILDIRLNAPNAFSAAVVNEIIDRFEADPGQFGDNYRVCGSCHMTEVLRNRKNKQPSKRVVEDRHIDYIFRTQTASLQVRSDIYGGLTLQLL